MLLPIKRPFGQHCGIQMGYIGIDQLNQGMVLADDVKDMNARLLLSKGLRIESKHIRMFKMWGIGEVDVVGDHDDEENTDSGNDPALIQIVADHTKQLFKFNDLSHALIKELFALSVAHRIRNQPTRMDEPVQANDNETPEPAAVVDIRTQIGKKNIKLPEIPSIVYELNEVIADPFSSADDIAKVVSKSPSLAALLLRIVNSAFYGFPGKIDSISRAVALIGSKEISALGLGISTMKLFKDIPHDVMNMHDFFKHSLACGILSRILAAHLNVQHTEQLFVSGLLHDIGRVIIYKYFPDQAKSLLTETRSSSNLLFNMESEFLGCRHTHIGRDLFRKWKLPYSLENCTYYHHTPSRSKDPLKAVVVHLADICAHALGLGTSGERFVPPLDAAACNALNIVPSTIKNVIKQGLHQLSFLESVFQEQE